MILDVKFQKFVLKEYWYFCISYRLLNSKWILSLGLKSPSGFQIYPSIHICFIRQQLTFADSFLNWSTFLFLNWVIPRNWFSCYITGYAFSILSEAHLERSSQKECFACAPTLAIADNNNNNVGTARSSKTDFLPLTTNPYLLCKMDFHEQHGFDIWTLGS